jgi:outer membrane protein TolC
MPAQAQAWLRVFATTMMACAVGGCTSISPALTESQVAGFAAYLSDELALTPEPLVQPLTVEEAVQRAVRYNHALRIKELEAALAEAKVRAQAGAMLPSIVAESDFYRRDRLQMSRSNASSTYSTSSDLRSISRDVTLSWNILDFGLSFVRARQGWDKALQQHEDANRVRARIVEETRSTYWRAAAVAALGPALAKLDREVADAVRLSRAAARDPQIDPLVPINYQRDILNTQRELKGLQTSLVGAMDQLKQSIGLPLIDQLPLAANRRFPKLELPTTTSADDIAVALRQRPEIRQHMYDLRVTADEVNSTILQMLPGVTLSRTFASDTNSHLLHSNWISWGSKIAGNLMDLARLPADLDAIDAQENFHRQSALAMAASVAMQIHIARARIALQMQAYRDAERFADVQRKLLGQVRATVVLNKIGRQALVREKLATLLAESRAMVAFADLHAAFAAYATAKGDPLIPERIIITNSWSPVDVKSIDPSKTSDED